MVWARMCFDGQRVIGAAFDGGIVSDHHALNAFNPTNARNDTGCGDRFIVNAPGASWPISERVNWYPASGGCVHGAVVYPGRMAFPCLGTTASPILHFWCSVPTSPACVAGASETGLSALQVGGQDGWALTRLRKQFPSNQHATDFRGACADFIELGIPQQTAGGEFINT